MAPSKAGKKGWKGPRSLRSNNPVQGDIIVGSGSVEDPLIQWTGKPPREEIRDGYYEMVREAAAVTGLKVWYIRSFVHTTTRYEGESFDTDPHFTFFADEDKDQPQDEKFDFGGHLYVHRDKQSKPVRFLVKSEFHYHAAEDPAPIWLWNNKTQEEEYKYWPDDWEEGEEDCEEPKVKKRTSGGQKRKWRREAKKQGEE